MNFEEKLIERIKKLEREVERLRVWERPAGGSGVTDHGALTGLGDNDHPQYLLTTGKAADSDKLDGIDSTGFATAGHDHDSDYLGITAKASDSDKLDNIDSTGFVQTSGNQTVGGIKTFTSIPALPATNPTTANQAVRKGFADATYLGISAKAADSDKLDGLDSTDFVRDIAYKVSAYRNDTAFTLTTSGTLYAIPLNAEEFDSHSQHDNATNPERFTCVKAGTYLITGMVTFTANATGNRDALLRVNGTNIVGQNRYPAMASGSTSVPAMALVELAVNDYVELIGRQYSGGSLTLYYANSISNHMKMLRLGS